METPATGEWERTKLSWFVPRAWSVAGTYSVADGFLVPTAQTKREYMPMAHEQLLMDFVRLGVGSDDDLTAFASRWGLPGYQEVKVRTVKGADDDNTEADPIAWVRAHANGVQTCMRLIEYLRDGNDKGLENYLRSLQSTAGEHGVTVFVHSGYGPFFDTVPHSVPSDESAEGKARLLLAQIVNRNLSGVRPQLLSADPDGALGLYYDYAALLDVIYWQLAQLAVNAERLARCAYCGGYFLRTHGRQQYCPSPDFDSDHKSESLCSRKARAKRARG